MVTKDKIFKRYMGTQPKSCLHLAFLVQRDLKGIQIPIPKDPNDEEQKRVCIEELLRHAKIVEKPEEGDTVFFVDTKNGRQPHIGTVFKDSKGRNVIFHSGEISSGHGFRARIDPLDKISRPFDTKFYINFDKSNPGVDPKDLPQLEDAGFFQLFLAFAAIVVNAAGFTAGVAFFLNLAIAVVGYLYAKQQAEDQAEARRIQYSPKLFFDRNTKCCPPIRKYGCGLWAL